MSTHPEAPLSACEQDRLRALHVADQGDAAREKADAVTGHRVRGSVVVIAYLLVVGFLIGGGYAAAAAAGLVPAVAGSALATRG